MPAFVIKVKFEEDTRRLTLEKNPSYEELVSTLKTLFSNLPSSFIIKYVDEDEDAVTISSDMELNEAIRVAATNNVLRLQLSAQSASNTARSAPANPLTNFPSLADFLSNPAEAQKWLESFVAQTPGGNEKAKEDVPDLVSLFQHMGLRESQKTASPDAQQQLHTLIQRLMTSPFVQQLLPQLVMLAPQLMPFLSGFSNNPVFQSQSADPKNETGNTETNIHHEGVICDACEAPIYGVRYKCTTCANYDLCSKCEAKPGAHDPSHALLKIQKPLNYGRGCPYMRPNHRTHINNNNEQFKPWHRAWRRTAQQNGFLSRFVQDVTIPDGTPLEAGQSFIKIWKLRNEGEIAWPAGTRLEFVGGDNLSSQSYVDVESVTPGSEIEIAVEMKAPSLPGRYVSYWKLSDSNASRFGQRVWVDIFSTKAEREVKSDSNSSSSQSTQTQNTSSMEVQTQTNIDMVSKSTGTTVASSTIGTSTLDDQMQKEDNTPSLIGSQVANVPLSPEVQQLVDMGFDNPEHLQHLVNLHAGDLVRVVQELLGVHNM